MQIDWTKKGTFHYNDTAVIDSDSHLETSAQVSLRKQHEKKTVLPPVQLYLYGYNGSSSIIIASEIFVVFFLCFCNKAYLHLYIIELNQLVIVHHEFFLNSSQKKL